MHINPMPRPPSHRGLGPPRPPSHRRLGPMPQKLSLCDKNTRQPPHLNTSIHPPSHSGLGPPSWCAPCVKEMPAVVKIYNQYKSKGFQIVGISLDQANSKDKVAKAMKRLGMKWPVIYDGKNWNTKGVILNKVKQIPMTFLIDREGKVRYAGLRQKKLHEAIKELVNEK